MLFRSTSDDSYELQERLMGDAERLIHQADAQNFCRNPLLLWESRIETIDEDVRINESCDGYRSLRVSSLGQRQIQKRSQVLC